MSLARAFHSRRNYSKRDSLLEMFREGRGASWLNPPKPWKSEIGIYVPSLIVKVVGREEGREVYSVV